MEMLFHHFALENRMQMWQVRRAKCERFQETRAHYRDYGSGWVIFGRTASGKGVYGTRNRAAYQSFMAIPHGASSARLPISSAGPGKNLPTRSFVYCNR